MAWYEWAGLAWLVVATVMVVLGWWWTRPKRSTLFDPQNRDRVGL